MCIATMKTQTAALRGKRVLERQGIWASVVSLDASLTEKGCAYGLSFYCASAAAAKKALESGGVGYGVIIGRDMP